VRFQLLWHEVSVEVDDDAARAAVGRMVQHAGHPFAPEARAVLTVERGDAGYVVSDNGDELARVGSAEAVLDVVFTRAYRRALELASLKGWLRVHGAVVAPGGRRMAVVGPAGAGKSTLTVDMLRRGQAIEGDESFLVRDGSVLTVPRRLHVKPGTVALLPDAAWLRDAPLLDPLAVRAVDPTDHGHPWALGTEPVSAMVALRRTDGPSAIEPLSAGEAARELIEQAFPLTESRAAIVREAAAVAAAAPAFVLSAGPDLRAAELLGAPVCP